MDREHIKDLLIRAEFTRERGDLPRAWRLANKALENANTNSEWELLALAYASTALTRKHQFLETGWDGHLDFMRNYTEFGIVLCHEKHLPKVYLSILSARLAEYELLVNRPTMAEISINSALSYLGSQEGVDLKLRADYLSILARVYFAKREFRLVVQSCERGLAALRAAKLCGAVSSWRYRVIKLDMLTSETKAYGFIGDVLLYLTCGVQVVWLSMYLAVIDRKPLRLQQMTRRIRHSFGFASKKPIHGGANE